MTVDKTSALRALLIRSWRERWTAVQWSIHLKDILPRGCCGDVYDLSGLILRQALSAPVPNALILSYLNHSIASGTVSHAALLESVSGFDEGLSKRPHCVAALLNIVQSSRENVRARGKPEDCLALATSLLKVNAWLLKIVQAASAGEAKEAEVGNCLRAVALVRSFLDDEFTSSLMYVGKLEEKETFCKTVNGFKRLSSDGFKGLPPSPLLPNPARLKRDLGHVAAALGADPILRDPAAVGLVEKQPNVYHPRISSFVHVIQPLLMYEAILWSAAPPDHLARLSLHLHALAAMHNVSFSDLVYETIRCLLISISQEPGLDSLKVDSFILIKLPLLLEKLSEQFKLSPVLKTPTDTYKAFDKILKNESLLDTLDCRCRCNMVDLLVQVVGRCSVPLLTDTERDDILKQRLASASKFPEPLAGKTRQFENSLKAVSGVIANMLRTLDAEVSSGPESFESILEVLCGIVSGESFDLLLAASAANGSLRSFVRTMVGFNQSSQESQGESVKNSLLRGALFDVTFLMIVHVAQRFGADLVLEESPEGTFARLWVSDLMAEPGGRVKPFRGGSMPDNLLQQLQNGELRTQVVKWQSICANVHVAMREVLVARWQEVLDDDRYGKIVEAMCSKLCALPVCVLAWLASCGCSVPGAFDVPAVAREFVAKAGESAAKSDVPHAEERLSLMGRIVDRTMADSDLTNVDDDDEAATRSLVSVWEQQLSSDRMTPEAATKVKRLHDVGGTDWFVRVLLDQLLKIVYRSRLDRAADLLAALFHVDVEACAASLLRSAVPAYLRCPKTRERLTDPHGSAVARLLFTCVCSAMAAAPEVDRPHGKAPKVEPEVERELGSFFELLQAMLLPSGGAAPSPATHFSYRLLEQAALRSGLVASRGHRGPVKAFFQRMGADFVPQLAKAVPELFDSMAVVTKLFDLSGQAGRKGAARVLCQLKDRRT